MIFGVQWTGAIYLSVKKNEKIVFSNCTLRKILSLNDHKYVLRIVYDTMYINENKK